jgi:hypothetical protein
MCAETLIYTDHFRWPDGRQITISVGKDRSYRHSAKECVLQKQIILSLCRYAFLTPTANNKFWQSCMSLISTQNKFYTREDKKAHDIKQKIYMFTSDNNCIKCYNAACFSLLDQIIFRQRCK